MLSYTIYTRQRETHRSLRRMISLRERGSRVRERMPGNSIDNPEITILRIFKGSGIDSFVKKIFNSGWDVVYCFGTQN